MNNYTTQCLLTIGKALDWTDQRFLMVSCHLYEITQGSVHQELHLCDPTHMLHLYRSVKQRQPVGGAIITPPSLLFGALFEPHHSDGHQTLQKDVCCSD